MRGRPINTANIKKTLGNPPSMKCQVVGFKISFIYNHIDNVTSVSHHAPHIYNRNTATAILQNVLVNASLLNSVKCKGVYSSP